MVVGAWGEVNAHHRVVAVDAELRVDGAVDADGVVRAGRVDDLHRVALRAREVLDDQAGAAAGRVLVEVGADGPVGAIGGKARVDEAALPEPSTAYDQIVKNNCSLSGQYDIL